MTAAEIARLAEHIAVESSWSLIETTSNNELEGGAEWMNIGQEYFAHVTSYLKLLVELKLAEVHPKHPNWVRRIED